MTKTILGDIYFFCIILSLFLHIFVFEWRAVLFLSITLPSYE